MMCPYLYGRKCDQSFLDLLLENVNHGIKEPVEVLAM